MRVWRRRVAGEGARLGRRFRPVRRSPRAPAAADAHRLESAAPREAQIVREAGEDAHAGRPYRMPERDAPAVHVGAIPVRLRVTPLAGNSKYLGCEGLVEVEEVEVRHPEPYAFEYQGSGWHRPEFHPRRIHPGPRPRHQPNQRREPEFGGPLWRRDDAHRRSVVLSARISGGDRRARVALRDRLQPGRCLEGGVGPGMLVCVDDDVTLPPRHRHADDLVGEASSLLGRDRVPV